MGKTFEWRIFLERVAAWAAIGFSMEGANGAVGGMAIGAIIDLIQFLLSLRNGTVPPTE